MNTPPAPDRLTAPASFDYEAQTADGLVMRGRIEAADSQTALWRLTALGLRVLSVGPAPVAPPRDAATGAPLNAARFRLLHEQLASITASGLPLERGLRLMGRELGDKNLASALDSIAAALEAGRPIDQAFESCSARLPPGYAALIRAGANTGQLPGLLLGLSQHLDLVQRMRQTMWRALAYPLVVLLASAVVMGVLGRWITPVLRQALADLNTWSHVELPWWSQGVYGLAESMPLILALAAILAGLAAAGLTASMRNPVKRAICERAMLAIPLLGAAIRCSLLARWCDAMRLAVASRLDLPGAIDLAGQATGSAALIEDGRGLKVAHQVGQPLAQAAHLRVVTPLVLAAIETAMHAGGLEAMLLTLRDLYRTQAEQRLAMFAAVARPASLAVLGLLLAAVIASILWPLITLLEFFGGLP
jgi:general secretion pathway protein F